MKLFPGFRSVSDILYCTTFELERISKLGEREAPRLICRRLVNHEIMCNDVYVILLIILCLPCSYVGNESR